MRISDWSSDVCSSDLAAQRGLVRQLWVQQAWVPGNHPRDDARTYRRGDAKLLAQPFEDAHLLLVHAFISDQIAQVAFALLIFQPPFEGDVNPAGTGHHARRSEARRVGKECVSKCRT